MGLQGASSVDFVTIATAKMNVEDTKSVLIKTKLNKEQLEEVLIGKGLAETEAQVAAATIIKNREQAKSIITANSLKTATLGLKAALKGVVTLIKSHPIIAAIAVVVAGATYAFNKISEDAEKKAEESRKLVEDTENAANSEKTKQESLDSLIQKYKELTKNGKLDASNRAEAAQIQSEINTLVGHQVEGLNLVNGELKTEYELLKGIQAEQLNTLYNKQKLAAEAAYSEANSVEYHNAPTQFGIDFNDMGRDSNQYTFKIDNDEDNEQKRKIIKLIGEIPGITVQEYITDGVRTEDDWMTIAMSGSYNISEWKNRFEEAIKKVEEAGYTVQNSKTFGKIVSVYNTLFGESSKAADALSKYQDLLQTAILMDSEAINAATAKPEKITDYLSIRQGVIDSVKHNPDIENALDNGLISEDDITKYVESYLSQLSNLTDYYISQESEDIAYEIGINLLNYDKTNYYARTDFRDWWESLSAPEIEMITAMKKQNKAAGIDDSQWTLEEWKRQFEEYKNSIIGGSNEIQSAFDNLMKETGTDSNPSFVEGIEKSVEKFQKLQEALQKVESGTITEKEKAALFKSFPELTAYANNLSVGIKNLTNSMRSDIVSQFDAKLAEFKNNGASEEDIQKLENYKNTILGIADAVYTTQTALTSMTNVFKDLDSVVKSYNENGYFSIENLEKLSSSSGQKYLQYLQYENGQLKINEEAYKKLVLAQIDEIETKAILQATSDLEGITNETAAKEYLASTNIELAKSQMTAAEAAFQYTLALKLAEGGNVAKAAQRIADNLNTLRSVFVSAREQAKSYSGAMLGVATATDKSEKASEKAKKALEAEQTALENAKKALENQKKALEKQKTGYTDALNAIKDLVSWVEKYITQIKKDEKEALEQRKKDHDEIIEKRKEEIELARKEAETAEELADLQKQYAKDVLSYDIASMDDSAAGKKAQKEASDKMLESDKNLRQKLSDNAYDMRIEELENDKELFDKNIDEQIEVIDKFLSDEVALHKAACKMIDEDRGELYGKLKQYCLQYTTTTEAEFNHMWQSAQAAIQKYNGDNITTYNLMNDLQGKIYDVDKAIDTVAESISAYETKIDGVKSKLNDLKDAAINVKNALNNSVPKYEPKPEYYYKYGGKTYYSYKTNREEAVADIVQQTSGKLPPFKQGSIKYEIQKYAKGTRYTKSNPFISQEDGFEAIFGRLQNGNYTLAPEGSQVFNSRMTDNLYNFANNPTQFIASKIGNYERIMRSIANTNTTNTNGDITVNAAPIYIQGDASERTATLLQRESKNIANDVMKRITKLVESKRMNR